MKFRQLLVLLVVLASCMIFATQAFAIAAILPPGDIIGTLPPILSLDPCFGASAKTNMGDMTFFDVNSGSNYYTEIIAYDLLVSGSPVVHVITTYKRVTIGGVDNVTMEDTFIDAAGSGTVFGHSVNRNQAGNIGIQGVFTGSVNSSGKQSSDIQGSYLTTNFGGTNRLCVFLH